MFVIFVIRVFFGGYLRLVSSLCCDLPRFWAAHWIICMFLSGMGVKPNTNRNPVMHNGTPYKIASGSS